jgi:dihydrofolate reductase
MASVQRSSMTHKIVRRPAGTIASAGWQGSARPVPRTAAAASSRFSRTLDKASWSNTKLVKADMPAEIRKTKSEPGQDMTILGSGSIVSQLAQVGLIDEYQMVVNPVVLGKGRTMFDGIKGNLTLKLTKRGPSAMGMPSCATRLWREDSCLASRPILVIYVTTAFHGSLRLAA